MNPFLSREMAELHIGELKREASAARAVERFREMDGERDLTVRLALPRDREAVRVLAALDGRHVPAGPMLVAEIDDELLAALPLEGGRAFADPFRRTAHLVAMLELRARQLRGDPKPVRLPLFGRLRHAAAR